MKSSLFVVLLCAALLAALPAPQENVFHPRQNLVRTRAQLRAPWSTIGSH
jgi:hypothetical protein